MTPLGTAVLGLGMAVPAVTDGAAVLRWTTEIAAGVLVVTGLAVGWMVHLRRLVRRRTAELEAKNRELERETAERRQAMEALELSDQRLRMAMEAAQLRTWHWDIASDRFDVLGDRPAELGPPLPRADSGFTAFLKPIHPDDLELVQASVRQTLETGEPLSAEFRVVLPNGSMRWKVVRGCAVRDAAGAITSLVGAVVDVTDRRRNEEELERSEERYCELFENANDIIYTHDLAGNFTSINRAAERVLGYTHAEVLRLNVRDVVAPEQVELAQQMIARKVAGSVARTEYELAVLGKAGRRVTLEVNTRLIRRDGEVVGVQGIARDVTERKRLESRLAQAQKMEAVGQLAGGIAHDFNNVLTAIVGNAQLAQLAGPLTPALRDRLDEIVTATQRAGALTRQLLVFSRHQQIDRRPVHLPEVLEDFMNMLRRIIGEDIEVRFSTAPDVPAVMADPAQIEQVALNLAVNARDAMPAGGRLAIEIDEVVLPRACGSGSAAPVGGVTRYVRLRVTDTGSGIRADVRERIFEPFFTTKPVGEGTGLGLAVVYGIVRQHEGLIEVESRPGEGTRFSVCLPAIETPVAVRREEPAPVASGGRETILVAEDEEALRRLTVRVLSRLGYSVIVAEDGQVALEQFAAHREAIDLLLLDVVMPRKGGHDVFTSVRAAGSHVPVVFMTGYSADVAPHALADETGCRVLYKPYDLDALAAAIRESLEGAGV